MDRRGWAGEVKDFIDFKEYGMNNVVSDQFKIGVRVKMADIIFVSRKEVIDTDNVASLLQEGITKVAA
jgi:hypothetical protein